jgi:hypothetical protein
LELLPELLVVVFVLEVSAFLLQPVSASAPASPTVMATVAFLEAIMGCGPFDEQPMLSAQG